MNLDATLSLEVVIAILAVLGAVWRLDGRIAESRKELKGEIAESRAELKGEITELRAELKGDIQRLETRIDTVETKVDDGNQRLARIEGRLEGREERLAAGSEAE